MGAEERVGWEISRKTRGVGIYLVIFCDAYCTERQQRSEWVVALGANGMGTV